MRASSSFAIVFAAASLIACKSDVSGGGAGSGGVGNPQSAEEAPTLPGPTRALEALRRRFVVVDDEGVAFATIPRGEAKRLERRDDGIVPVFEGRTTLAALADLTLPTSADRAFRLALGEMAIDVRLEGATAATAQIAADGVLYPNAVLGGTLLHVPLRAGTEESLVLSQKPTASELRYDVALHGVSGLRLTNGVL